MMVQRVYPTDIIIFLRLVYNGRTFKDLYYNPKTGYSSKDKLYRRAKELDDNITLKIIKEFLDRQPTAQITKQAKR